MFIYSLRDPTQITASSGCLAQRSGAEGEDRARSGQGLAGEVTTPSLRPPQHSRHYQQPGGRSPEPRARCSGRKCNLRKRAEVTSGGAQGDGQLEATVLAKKAEEKRFSSGRGGSRRHLSPRLRLRLQPEPPVTPARPPVSWAEAASRSCHLSALFWSLASFPTWIWSEYHPLNQGRQRPGDPTR